ncbi:MAG: preprotein translocase subunit SecE [Phycisphaerales bacterium]|nr:preprotein translocase subunit SecE [Planctomycetaceae bacterium]
MGTFFRELMHVRIYKRSQGRVTRQVTFAGIALIVALGLMRLSMILAGKGLEWQFALPGVLLAALLWASYRLVNVPGVADFLIAVEAEMNKVSWPTRTELFRASMVVLILIFSLGAILATYDLLWGTLLHGLGIR